MPKTQPKKPSKRASKTSIVRGTLFDPTSVRSGETITLPMLPVTQGSFKMWAFVSQSSHLRKIASFSRREEDKEKGFQRHFKDARLRAIGKYVNEGRPIPNNIIMALNPSLVSIDEAKNTISLPTNQEAGLVIDGQHRLLGFQYADHQYPLLVMGYLDVDLKQNASVFVTINTEQKRLSTSLVLDLLGIHGSDDDVHTRCRDLVARLNEDDDSPWFGRIDMTGESKSGLISLVNFVRKLKPLLTGVGFMKSFDFTEQSKILLNYWRGIQAVFADQWGTSQLTKTVGFGALMNILPDIFPKTQARSGGAFTVTAVVDMFKLIKDFQFDSDTLGSGAGNKAEMKAAQILLEAFDDAMADGKSKLILD